MNAPTSTNLATASCNNQEEEEVQEVVILTHMADGLLADRHDVENQQQAEEATDTTVPEETVGIQNTDHRPDESPRGGGFSDSFRKRFSRKDRGNSNVDGGETKSSTPISIPPATKNPKETLKAVYAAGKYKAGLTWNVLAVQSFMAGVYIAFAGQLFLSVGGGVLGASVFPVGLIAVVLTSAELFTGDALVFVAAVLGGQVPVQSLLRNWIMAWTFNFAGCVMWAYFMGYASGALSDLGAKDLAIAVAELKALNDFPKILIRAIGANFMVCIAVWQGTCAEEVAGKVFALWFPVAAFVMMGFDHVVANMFLIPMGMMFGANVSVGRMIAALAVATVGNVIGGGIFVGAVYWYVFDSMASFGSLTTRIQQSMRNINVGRALNHNGHSSYRGNHPHSTPRFVAAPRQRQEPEETA